MTIEYETLIEDLRAENNFNSERAAHFVPRLSGYNLPSSTVRQIALGLVHPERENAALESWWTAFAFRELQRNGYHVWSIVPTCSVCDRWHVEVSPTEVFSDKYRNTDLRTLQRVRNIAYFVAWNKKSSAAMQDVWVTYIPLAIYDIELFKRVAGGLSAEAIPCINPADYLKLV